MCVLISRAAFQVRAIALLVWLPPVRIMLGSNNETVPIFCVSGILWSGSGIRCNPVHGEAHIHQLIMGSPVGGR